MKKILFGIALIAFSIYLVVLDLAVEIPTAFSLIYPFAPWIGLVFCFIGFFEKKD